MPRWTLIVLLVAAVICAGVGVGLLSPFSSFGAAGFGWTAYAPLSKVVYSASYEPINVTWLFWAPKLGIALLAIGAGTTGAALVGLLVHRRGVDRLGFTPKSSEKGRRTQGEA